MTAWALDNSIWACGLVLVAISVCRLLRSRPALCHLVWLLVLLRLVAPPLPRVAATAAIHEQVSELRMGLVALIPAKAGGVEPRLTAADLSLAGHGLDEATSRPEVSTEDLLLRGSGAAAAMATEAVPGGEAPEASTRRRASVLLPDARGVVTPAPLAAASEGAFFTRARLHGFFLAAWALGALVVLAVQLRRMRKVGRIVGRARPAPASLLEAVAGVAARLGIAAPKTRVLDGVGSPFVWGFGRPTLCWPAARLAQRDQRGDRAVLTHELAHLKRRDHWTAWLEIAAVTLFWWNPLVWFIRRRTRFYAELACDAWAVSVWPQERRVYAESLLEVAEQVSSALALGHGESEPRNFERRLVMILRDKLFCRVQPWAATAALVVALAFWPSSTPAQQDPAKQNPKQHVWSIQSDSDIDSALRFALLARKAKFSLDAKDSKRATEAYGRLVSLEPDNGRMLLMFGYCLLGLGRHDEAVAAFGRQLALGYKPATAHYNLACAAAASGAKERAFVELDKALRAGFTDRKHVERDPDLASLHDDPRFAKFCERVGELTTVLERADEAYTAAKWDEAAARYAEVAERMPEDGQAFHHLGYALCALGRYEACKRAFTRQLELGYRPIAANYNLACTHARLGETEVAMRFLRRSVDEGLSDHKLLRTDPDLATLHEEEGFAGLRARVLAAPRDWAYAKAAHEVADWEGAVELYRKVLDGLAARMPAKRKGMPGRSEVLGRLAEVLAELGQYEKALGVAKERVRERQDLPDALLALGRIHAKLGSSDAAWSSIASAIDLGLRDREAIEKAPELDALRAAGGVAKLLRRVDDAEVLDRFEAADWTQCLQHAEARLARDAEHGPSLLRLGWARLRLRDYDAAVAAFKRQDAAGHMPGIARYNVACALANQGDADGAFVWLAKATDAGFVRPEHVASDPDLAGLRGDPRFAAYLASLRDAKTGKRARPEGKERADKDDG